MASPVAEKRYVTTITEVVGGTTITETATIDPPGSFPTGAALDKRYVTTETIVFGTTTIIETVTVDPFPTRR